MLTIPFNKLSSLIRTVCGIALFLVAAPPALAAETLTTEEARIRLLPGDLPAAGYFTLRNTGDADVILVGAQSPAFGSVEMHRSVDRDGVASMQPVEQIELAAGEQIAFAPQGYHLMLMQRARPLAIGEEVEVTLLFEDAQRLIVTFQTVSPASL
ncbi:MULTISPECIES: copper chaperone PCu(A)C [Halomonadaceae]|uniref:Copper(I)-binding protein n=1 Tax=Modicisalibacter ilicicola DSM 19980 TaxID=1121942 RepID=A0A1M5D0Q8_9GAMM|nr:MULTISPECIES: copper chaperone PCu(A)C [Halomonas]SHF60417.1 hypothetical protein SAMN02745148_03095 [Halomonas ilicicola DSM 19980]